VRIGLNDLKTISISDEERSVARRGQIESWEKVVENDGKYFD